MMRDAVMPQSNRMSCDAGGVATQHTVRRHRTDHRAMRSINRQTAGIDRGFSACRMLQATACKPTVGRSLRPSVLSAASHWFYRLQLQEAATCMTINKVNTQEPIPQHPININSHQVEQQFCPIIATHTHTSTTGSARHMYRAALRHIEPPRNIGMARRSANRATSASKANKTAQHRTHSLNKDTQRIITHRNSAHNNNKLQTSTPPRLPIFSSSDRRDSRSVGCFHPEQQQNKITAHRATSAPRRSSLWPRSRP